MNIIKCLEMKIRTRLFSSKVFHSSRDAVSCIKSGSSVLFGGFGLCGIPENLILALRNHGAKDLDCVSNDAGVGDFGFGQLLANNQVKSLTASYLGEHKTFLSLWNKGKVQLHLVPQGTLAEKLRSGGAGIPAFYSAAGVGTSVQYGGLPISFSEDGKVVEATPAKECKVFNGKEYVLEKSITADFALIKAWKGDKNGNLVFRGTARNFNPDCAKAARVTIAEVEQLVDVGEIGPDEIHLPGIYVNRIIQGEVYEKRIEKLTVRQSISQQNPVNVNSAFAVRSKIARRAAQELRDGMNVNIGIGIPTIVSNHLPEGIHVSLHSENGLLGTGPYPLPGEQDADIVNAGKETVSYLPGSSTFQSSESFAMIRGQHIDITILGALQVSAQGDLANWIIPGKSIKGMGGAMDLVASCRRVVVVTTHTNVKGEPKIRNECTLPLTGRAVADKIITELAVFDVIRGKGLILTEIASGVTLEEIASKTEAAFEISPNLVIQ